MKIHKGITLFAIIFSFVLTVSIENAHADETIEVEIKYTNGDRADFNGMKLLVYQDFDKVPILEKKLENNPDFITVPENHRYKIEVYANGMYADVGYIQLENKPTKLDINIPLSGGIKFEVFYKNGHVPIKDALVVLKSQDNSEWRRGTTNDQGETTRHWIQSTSKQEDHYIADVYLEDMFLISYFPIKILPGIATDQKIITEIPEIVETLVLVNLYEGSKTITSADGDYRVTLMDLQGNEADTSNVNFRGDVQFSNLKSGTYTVKITTENEEEDILWPQTKIHIIGDVNKFNIFKNSQNTISQENPFLSCNCISFRLDDIQDYWLADTQIELIDLFSEKNIPLTVGVIGSLIGSDEKLVSALKDNLKKDSLEIANHSWNNDVLSNVGEEIQEKYIMDTNEKILEIFEINPTSFIPPQNIYDENTIKILKRNNYTHLSSHIDENTETSGEDSLFYNVPAVTETGVLLNGVQWQMREKEHTYERIISSVEQKGYAIVMMHPQEFSLNEQGEYDDPNQNSLSELSLLLDKISQTDAELVNLSKVTSHSEIIEQEQATDVIDKIPKKQEIEDKDTCNCVAFRLDDIQDVWLNDIQISIMSTFIEKNTPITIGIIANSFGHDQKITEFVKQHVNTDEDNIEIATKGIGLTSFTNYDKIQQNEKIKESLDLIESSIDIRAQIFIPPENKFNSDTLEILEENNITHISSSLINGDSPPFEFENQSVYRFPLTASTGKYNSVKNVYEGVPSQQTMSESIQAINNYGYSVIVLHAQEFSTIENSTYTNVVNEKQINELKKLIEGLKEKGYKIVPIGEINSNLIVIVPEWVKNNAGWWADGSIDDKTFIQGIEHLVQEKIIKVSGQPETSNTEKSIPEWVKNNAGWWADGSIDDKTFIQGMEYLVKTGVILH